MNRLLIHALQTIMRTLIGSDNYQHLTQLVEITENTELHGKEKRERVIEEAQQIGLSVGTALLNLAIEVAVTALRNRK